jgi:hypothetical protein
VDTKHFNFPDTVPLVQWENGTIRVRGSRVEADEYLREQEATGDYIRKTIESTPEYRAFREEFLRRKAEFRKN